MSKKKIIAIVSFLAVAVISASIISYSIATSGKRDKISSDLTRRGATLEADYTSNIDLIIENSNKSTDAENFNIVEIIPSSASASDLGSYIASGSFKKYVIDANSETDPKGVMKSGKIKLDTIKVTGSTSLDENLNSNITGEASSIREILDNADLIYISGPSYTAYDGNMSEDVYNYLHTYSLGKNKPVIIDYVTKNNNGNVVTNAKYSDLINVISNNHIRFKTFAWEQGISAENFFKRNGSYYVKYNTNLNAASGKVLVVTSNQSEAGSMYDKMKSGDEKSLISTAYYGNEKPSKWDYTFRTPNNLTAAEVAGYDFVLLENNIMNESVDASVYSALKTLSESGKYIFYDYRSSSSGGDSGSSSVSANNNYLKLMELLVTNKGVSRYSHVLATSYGFFTSLNDAGEAGTDGAKTIADIINAGDYRGSGSNGSNGKVFRVLELQPCYPIDTELAESRSNGNGIQYSSGVQGNYYTSPSEVMSGVTKDEVEDGTEYYDFDLSRAKIAYATGLSYNQIQVDQMSTSEFISKKDVVLETYDLVYIGGDTSALTPGINKQLLGWITGENALEVLTSFDMFTHTGQLVTLMTAPTYNSNMGEKVKNTPGQTTDDAYGTIYIGGKKQTTVTEYNGNDINNIKYEELKEYVSKGMPVIVEQRVKDAFEESKEKEGSRLEQMALREIDPDSWMYKLLDYIYDSKDGSNVVWGLDTVNNEVTLEEGNADRKYGNTLGSALTVFDTEINDRIVAVINSSAVRPSLTVTSSPKEYSEGNPNSYNSVEDGFKITAYAKPATESNGDKFELSLYIDVDGNGVFSEGAISGSGECAQTKEYTYSEKTDADGNATPSTVTLQYNDMEEDFYGIISWKVVAKDVDTGLVSSVTGYAYYERDEDVEKKEVEILQIMPRTESVKNAFNTAIKNNTSYQTPENDGHSLYLCTECQLNMYRAEYNILNNGTVGRNTISTRSEYQGIDMGLHEHKFGIVKFDSVKQDEDWESNLADSLIGENGDYNIDVDIMYADEFEDLVAQVQKQTDEEIEANKLLMQQKLGELEAAEQDPNYIAAEEALKAELIAMHGKSGITMSDHFKEFAEAGDYYKVWFYNAGKNFDTDSNFFTYKTLYNTYIKYKDKVVKAKQEYRKYRRLSYTADKWMAMNYSLVVLGFAEDFGGEDMNDDACQMIADYVNRGGSMLNTHDSTTKYEKAGAMNITKNLREVFGMDRFHVTGTAEGSGGDSEATATELTDTIRVSSFEYTEAVTEPVDADYVVKVIGDNQFPLATFTIPANNPQDIHIIGYLRPDTYLQQAKDPEISMQPAVGNSTTVNLSLEGIDYSNNSFDIPDGTSVIVCRRVKVNEWSTTDEQVATGKLNGGLVTLTIPQAKEITTPAKTTKAFSDDTTVVLSNQDKNYTVSVVDSNDSGTGSITETSAGTVHNDLSEKITVKVQLAFPAGTPDNLKAGHSVTIVHNVAVYTRSTDSDGVATFELPQISSQSLNNISSTSLRYRHFTTADSSLYFFTERAVTDNYVQWNEEMLKDGLGDTNRKGQWASFGYNSPVGMTDPYVLVSTTQNSNPYKYVEYDARGIQWDMGYELKGNGEGPNGASQVNKGIVTTYPYLISSELKISTTHAQTFALDMEDKDVAVWYTLSAGTGTTKSGASYYAATPHDGMNSYYLYSKGNLFYCGAGHSIVTGPKRDNNDERRLFINVIVNSVRNANIKPKISVHRKDTNGAEVTQNKNEKLNVDGDGNYYYNVDDNEETPEFDFKVRVDSKADLGEVYVFYDLDYGIEDEDGNVSYSNSYVANDANHVLIAQYNTKSKDSKKLASKELAKLREYKDDAEDGNENGYKKLQLKPEYFQVYGGYYTYIVIQATDSNGKTSYQRIKINLIPKLWDLTRNDTLEDSVIGDISDRIKYHI